MVSWVTAGCLVLGLGESVSALGVGRLARRRSGVVLRGRGLGSPADTAHSGAGEPVDVAQAQSVVTLCARLCAMLTRLSGLSA
jgi:hypothetical protein